MTTVKEHCVDIRKGTTEPLQQPGELRDVPRQPGVDEEQLRTVLDEVEVDHVVPEAVHSGYGEGRQRASDVDTYSPRQFRGAGVDHAAETLTIPAAIFSSRCLTLLVPAITTVTGERLSSHASRA